MIETGECHGIRRMVHDLIAHPLGKTLRILVLLDSAAQAASLVPFINKDQGTPVIAVTQAPTKSLIYCPVIHEKDMRNLLLLRKIY